MMGGSQRKGQQGDNYGSISAIICCGSIWKRPCYLYPRWVVVSFFVCLCNFVYCISCAYYWQVIHLSASANTYALCNPLDKKTAASSLHRHNWLSNEFDTTLVNGKCALQYWIHNINLFKQTLTHRRRCQSRKVTASSSGAIRVRRLAQQHLDTRLGGAGDRTSNLLVTSHPALPTETPDAR